MASLPTPDSIANEVIAIYKSKAPITANSDAVKKIIDLHALRVSHGMTKYGKTVAGNNLAYSEWLEHHMLELMDATLYATKQKRLLIENGVSDHPHLLWLQTHLSHLTDAVIRLMNEMMAIAMHEEVLDKRIREAGVSTAQWPRGDAAIRKKWTSPAALTGHPNLFPPE